MNNNVPSEPKAKPRKGRGKLKVIIPIIIVVVVVVVGFYLLQGGDSPMQAAAIQTGVVTRGDISQVITGSGSLSPLEKFEVLATVSGDIIRDYIEEGQVIKKGDLLYEISHEDTDNSIKRSRLGLERAQMSHDDLVEQLQYLDVYSPVTGNISEIFVKEGDDIQKGAQLAKVINNDDIIVKVPFVSSVAKDFYVGQTAQVFLADLLVYLDGTISWIASGTRVVDNYTEVTDIEIILHKPGNIASGQKGWVTIGGKDSPYEGVFENGEEEFIIAKTSGKVKKIDHKLGDYIYSGDLFTVLENENLDTDIKNSKLSIEEAQLSLSGMYEQLDNYRIKSPINGTVLQKNSKAGDTLGNSSNSNNILAVIVDMSKMTFTMNVDELDITNIKKGQRVEITADATPGQVYEGYVDNISMIGVSNNGVTVYPVEIVLSDYGDLMPGMNVNASIMVQESANTLMIPVSALERGNIVMVKRGGAADSDPSGDGSGLEPGGDEADSLSINTDDGVVGDVPLEGPPVEPSGDDTQLEPAGDADAPVMMDPAMMDPAMMGNMTGMGGMVTSTDGFEPVEVEIGISNKDFVEILSGLSEGDIVLLTNFAVDMGGGGMMRGGTVMVGF